MQTGVERVRSRVWNRVSCPFFGDDVGGRDNVVFSYVENALCAFTASLSRQSCVWKLPPLPLFPSPFSLRCTKIILPHEKKYIGPKRIKTDCLHNQRVKSNRLMICYRVRGALLFKRSRSCPPPSCPPLKRRPLPARSLLQHLFGDITKKSTVCDSMYFSSVNSLPCYRNWFVCLYQGNFPTISILMSTFYPFRVTLTMMERLRKVQSCYDLHHQLVFFFSLT